MIKKASDGHYSLGAPAFSTYVPCMTIQQNIPLLRIFCATAALFLVAACATAPPAPDRDMREQSSFAFDMSDNAAAVNAQWWSSFDDAYLTRLITDGLNNNASLDVASANLQTARAIADASALSRSPSTSAAAGAELGRPARAGQDIGMALSTGLGASWEIDAFGRIEAEIQGAEFGVDAAREAQRDIAVIVASDIALNYAALRGAQRRLDVGRQNAEAQADALELLRQLLENGRANQLDVERAEAQYRTTLASLPTLEGQIQIAISRLAALVGEPSDSLRTRLVKSDGAPVVIPENSGLIQTGTIEQLLRRRPDIRRADALIGQRLSLGEVARARLFPTVTLSADISSLFDRTNDIGDLNSIGFGIGPSISWAGPDLRRVNADIDIADAQTKAAFAVYEETVLGALTEVEVAITAYGKELERREDLIRAAESARRALEIARLRFEEGLDDFLDVLDAQRTVLDAEDRLAQSRLTATNNAIAAYRALGGVWMNDDTRATGQDIALE